MQYVYLLRAGENHYKVGVAKSVKKRLAGIQTSNPTKIEIVSIKLLDDAYAIESELHQRLNQWNVSGEWFELEPAQVINLLIEIGKYPEPDLATSIRLRDILASHSENQKRIERKLNIVTDLAASELARKEIEAAERAAKKLEQEPEKESKQLMTDQDLFEEAIQIGMAFEKISTSLLQRKLRIGYGRAARLVEELEEQGIVTEMDGSRPRSVNMEKALVMAQNIIDEPVHT